MIVKHLIELRLEEEGTVVVEVEASETGGTTRISRRPGEIVEEAKETFEQALSKFRPATEKVLHTLRDLTHAPKETEIEFGFMISAVAEIVVASASTEANYKVTLRWKQAEQLVICGEATIQTRCGNVGNFTSGGILCPNC